MLARQRTHTAVFMLDEHLTSQMCSSCGCTERLQQFLTGDGRQPFALKTCPGCQRVMPCQS